MYFRETRECTISARAQTVYFLCAECVGISAFNVRMTRFTSLCILLYRMGFQIAYVRPSVCMLLFLLLNCFTYFFYIQYLTSSHDGGVQEQHFVSLRP